MNANLRDHLANERTFLAWLSTGLALAFGLVVERLSLFLHYLGAAVSPRQSIRTPAIGLMLMWIGTALGPLGLWRFLVERRNIGEPSHPIIDVGCGHGHGDHDDHELPSIPR